MATSKITKRTRARPVTLLEQLIAASSGMTELCAFGQPAVDLLASEGAERRATIYGCADRPPYVIVSAWLIRDGMRFSAQFSRDATDEECTRLKGERYEHDGFISARL